MGEAVKWTHDLLLSVLSLRARRFSYSRIGRELKLTRGQVAGALSRFRHNESIIHIKSGGRGPADDSRYIEKWADRKDRLARERAA